MPQKIKKLQSKIFYKGPSSRGRFGKYGLRMSKGSEYLQYKNRYWKKFYFKNVVSWEAFPGGYIGTFMDSKHPPRIILKTASGRSGTEEREFAIPHEEFDKWLYWIIHGVMKYSKATIPDEYLEYVPQKHRRKLTSRLDLRRFEMLHLVFIAVAKKLDDALELKQRLGPAPVPINFHPDVVKTGPKVDGRTRGGMAYGRVKRSLGSGGSAAIIYEIDRLLQPILMKNEDGSNPRIERPSEPMAIKVAKQDDENRAYKELVREAQLLAAIGIHRNIIGLIDAQLVSRKRLYLFLEKGDHDMGDYVQNEKNSQQPLPTLPLIKKFAEGILAGITHMNQRRIYHLDMKPENVLICDNTAKIIDFGLTTARALDSKEEMLTLAIGGTWSAYGTPYYIPPESWEEDGGKDGRVSDENGLAKRDSFAVGMTLFEALLGPFLKEQRIDAKRTKPPPMPDHPNYSKPRITHWQGLVQDPAHRETLRTAGLVGVAKVASGLIDEDPEKRLFVEHALTFLRDDLERQGFREKRRKANLGRVRGAHSGRNRSSPSPQRPRTRKVRPERASWNCRNCNRSFTFKPMRCTCGLLVHSDGDPLFIRV
jgi:serine/threonine protein kinase